MRFFKKSSDPLTEELRKLEKKQRSLEKEVSRIEHTLQNPSAPETSSDEVKASVRGGAVFRPDDTPLNNQTRRRSLKIQNQIARNRFITACILLLILFFVVYRVLN